MPAKDINNLKPGSKVYAYLVPKTYDGSTPPKSPIIEIDVPTTNNGQQIYSNNESVEQHVYGDGSLVSGSSGGRLSASGTMYIDGTGLHAYNLLGASTVFISSEDGSAYFSGSLVSSAGSIGGWLIAPGEIYSGKVHINSGPTNPKIYMGNGNYASKDTGFYVDSDGRFSLGNQLVFYPGSSDLSTSTEIQTTASLDSTSASLTNVNVPAAIKIGMTVSGSGIPIETYVKGISGSTVFISKNPNSTGTSTIYFHIDDFADLTIAGRIHGIVDSVQPVPDAKINSSIISASTNNSSSIVVFATTGHAFVAGERIILSGLPSTNNLDTMNYAASTGNYHLVYSAPDSSSFSISYGGITGTGNVSSLTAVASLQELTMGLHPAESGLHDAGTGIRLDKYNWWFTNNQFRVGTLDSYFKWDGTKFSLNGSGDYNLQMSVGNKNADTYMAIFDSSGTYTDTYSDTYTSESLPDYADDLTPFYVDATGKFSLGSKLTWNSASSLLTVSGTINSTSGSIGGWTINKDYLSNGSGSTLSGLSGTDFRFFIGGGPPNGIGIDPSFESITPSVWGGFPYNFPPSATFLYTYSPNQWFLGDQSLSTYLTIVADTSNFYQGTRSLKITKNSAGGTSFQNSLMYKWPFYLSYDSSSISGNANKIFWDKQNKDKTFSVYVKSVSGTVPVRIKIVQYNGSSFTDIVSTASSATTASWTRIILPIPANTLNSSTNSITYGYTALISLEDASNGDSIYLDSTKLEIGSAPFAQYTLDSAKVYATNDGSFYSDNAAIGTLDIYNKINYNASAQGAIIAGQKSITPGSLAPNTSASIDFSESNGYYVTLTLANPGTDGWKLKEIIYTTSSANYLTVYNTSSATVNFGKYTYNYIGVKV